jgi:hypothetical protein
MRLRLITIQCSDTCPRCGAHFQYATHLDPSERRRARVDLIELALTRAENEIDKAVELHRTCPSKAPDR